MLRVSHGTNNFRRASDKENASASPNAMFLLVLCLLVWSLSVLMVACFSGLLCLLLRIQFHLCRAEILVVEPHEDSFRIKAVDVTEELRSLGNGPSQTLAVLPSLARKTPEKVADLDPHRAHRAASPPPPPMTTTAGNQHQRRHRRVASTMPLCFVDIRYTAQPNRLLGLLLDGQQCAGSYRCLYPLYSYADAIAYPPLRGSEWLTHKKTSKLSAISNAVLTMRIHGSPTCQVLCNVTDRLRPLEGPFHDFHRKSSPGYQLRKHILRAVLGSDIQALHDSATKVGGGGGVGEPASSSSSSLSSSSSFAPECPERQETGADLAQSKTFVRGNSCSMSVSVRFQFRSHDHRVDVITLRAS